MADQDTQPTDAAAEQPDTCWYVMRDLTRPNAKLPAYIQLTESGYTVFTPMHSVIRSKGGKRVKLDVPFLHDLLFVNSSREKLDEAVDRTTTLQYRYLHGSGALYRRPMTVGKAEMDRFIYAVRAAGDSLRYYHPTEITPAMIGRRVRIVGGAFEGFEGNLQSVRGTSRRRLFISIPDVVVATVEVQAEYIQLV